jgi:hypothetical protein
MANKWLVHIKKTMKTMKSKGTYKKGMGLKQVILAAKKTWHKAKKGGADSDSDSEMKDVDLTTPAKSSEPVKPDALGEVGAAGGRRKTRRRRHSRRR